MINLILKEDFDRKTANINEGCICKATRGHLDWIFAEMISEDGTNFFQGILGAELYKTTKGTVLKIHKLWIAPECRNIGFGSAFIEWLKNYCQSYVKENNFPEIYAITSVCRENEDLNNFFGKLQI